MCRRRGENGSTRCLGTPSAGQREGLRRQAVALGDNSGRQRQAGHLRRRSLYRFLDDAEPGQTKGALREALVQGRSLMRPSARQA